MGLHSDGRVLHPTDLRAGANPARIRTLKRALAKVSLYPKRPVYSGQWNESTRRAVMSWFLAKPKESKQARLDALGKASGLF